MKCYKSYWTWEVEGLSTAKHSLLEVKSYWYIIMYLKWGSLKTQNQQM